MVASTTIMEMASPIIRLMRVVPRWRVEGGLLAWYASSLAQNNAAGARRRSRALPSSGVEKDMRVTAVCGSVTENAAPLVMVTSCFSHWAAGSCTLILLPPAGTIDMASGAALHRVRAPRSTECVAHLCHHDSVCGRVSLAGKYACHRVAQAQPQDGQPRMPIKASSNASPRTARHKLLERESFVILSASTARR